MRDSFNSNQTKESGCTSRQINKNQKTKKKAIPGNRDQPERVSVDLPGDFGDIKESWLGTALVSSEYALLGPSLLPVRVNHSLIPRRNQRRPHQRRQTNFQGAKAVQHKQGCQHSLKPGAKCKQTCHVNKSPLNTHINIYLPNDSVVVAVVVAVQPWLRWQVCTFPRNLPESVVCHRVWYLTLLLNFELNRSVSLLPGTCSSMHQQF